MAQATETPNRERPQPDTSKQITSLADYDLLGRSGLRVSPLSFGTATFGNAWGPHWGTEIDNAKVMLKRYVDAGGNFIDTANTYHEGQSEEITGQLVKELFNRDSIVIATKFAFGALPGDPNSGGNGRKNIMRSLDASLKRLETDYIDLYWMHNWDTVTPPEELMSTLNQLVQSGKVRYIGLSNPPAWYLGRAQTIAELRGWEKIAAIQMEYSLAMRNIEFEYVDAALEMGIGILPWSPLANGLLTGKYRREGGQIKGDGRLANAWVTDPHIDPLEQKNHDLVEGLVEVAKQLNRTPAQVALNWVTRRPAVVSTIIGATKLSQLEDNLQALEFVIPDEMLAKLNKLSEPKVGYPYFFHQGELLANVNSSTRVRKRSSFNQHV